MLIRYLENGAQSATSRVVGGDEAQELKAALLEKLLTGEVRWVRIYGEKGSRKREFWTRARDTGELHCLHEDDPAAWRVA